MRDTSRIDYSRRHKYVPFRQFLDALCGGVLASFISGCMVIHSNAYTNTKAGGSESAGQTQCAGPSSDPAADTFDVDRSHATWDATPYRGHRDTLFILALSGGGSRAANWSAQTMLRLQDVFRPDHLNLLGEVDVISSVSGGSLPAAYYAISTDTDPSDPDKPVPYGRRWNDKTVTKIMEKDYIVRWFGNWFWPTNIAQYWFTAYDRTDIMAQTFADNIYDTLPAGRDLRMHDLRCERPYLILNAANATRESSGATATKDKTGNDRLFSFTTEEFENLGSDLGDYELSRAVMASAAFPGVFNDMTLRDYTSLKGAPTRYVHVFDGGNNDNLGLDGATQVMRHMTVGYKNLVVILIDSYTDRDGVDSDRPDPRGFFDFIVDTNFLNATGSLLFRNRDTTIANFKQTLAQFVKPENLVFYHIQFSDLPEGELKHNVNKIATNFKIDKQEAERLRKAADTLITPTNRCLLAIKELIQSGTTSVSIDDCSD